MTNNDTDGPDGLLKPTDHIGKYEIRERLGAGGQSVVYKAYDALLDRHVAIKQVAAHLAQDPHYLRQLRENLRKIARLGEKNDAIVTIHEVIEDPRGLFYVMEFVEGHTLDTLINQTPGPIEPKVVLLTIFRLAAALHEVHSADIVHRDMKPGNIIMTEGLRPKIIDFGVAAVPGGDVSMPLATTKYLAPELYNRPDVDGRADLYSLGFIAYEMLLGREKFNEIFQDIVRDKHSEALRWMKWHGNESVTAPESHEVTPSIPPALSRIVAKLMSKNPDDRYADTEQLGRAIKDSFSPRGRRAGPTGGSVPARLSAGGGMGLLEGVDLELAASPGSADGSTSWPLTPADGAVGEIPQDQHGPATVPLPKGPLSRGTRTVLIAAGCLVFLGLLAGGVVWMVQMRAQRDARRVSARDAYQKGAELFKEEKFPAALEKFEYLLKRYHNTPQGRKAVILAAMCRARQAIMDRQWDQAQLFERDARRSAEALLEKTDDENLAEWLRRRLGDIDEIGRSRFSSNEFFNAMLKANSALKNAAAAEDFDRIARRLNASLGAEDVVLTASQSDEVKRMNGNIARGKFLFIFDGYVRQGDGLARQGRYAPAETAYRQGGALFAAGSAAAGVVPQVQRASKLAELDEKLRQLAAARQEQAFFQAIRQAEQNKDPAALKSALTAAIKLKTLPAEKRKQFRQRLAAIELAEGLARARKAMDEGNLPAARDALNAIVKLDPKNVQARQMLAGMEKAAARAKLIAGGDQALLAHEFDKALTQYQQAGRLGPSDALSEKIIDCRFEIELQRANDLAKAGKYDEAAEAYNKARQIKPANSAQVDSLLVLMNTQKQYGDFLAKGDEAMKKNKWRDAVRWYTRAKQIQPGREIDDRISLTNYKKHVTDGRAALENENWPAARWNFKQALKYMDTPEARALLEKANAKVSDD